MPASLADTLGLTWKRLNEVLLETEDEERLMRWLAVEMTAGHRTRAKRILGRLSAVRRRRERAALPPKSREGTRVARSARRRAA